MTAAGENDNSQDDEPDALVVEKTAQTVIHSITYFHMESSFVRIESFWLSVIILCRSLLL